MAEEKFYYPEEKQNLIKTYTNEQILLFLNDFAGSAQTILNNKVLKDFVVDKYQHIKKDNTKKYGDETKKNFCKALRGELNEKGYFADRQNHNKITPQEKAFQALIVAFKIWYNTNDKLAKHKMPEKEANNEEWENLINNLLNNNRINLLPKETFKILYDFSPVLPNANLETKINQCQSKYIFLNNEQVEKCKDLKYKVSELQNKLSDLQNKNKKYQQNVENMTKCLEQKDNEIKLLKSKIIQNNDSEQNYKELNLKYEEEKIHSKTLEQKIKQLKSTVDVEKLKESLQIQLKEKDAIIQELNKKIVDYDDLKQKNDELSLKNDSLQKIRTMNLKQIYADVENNKEYQRKLKQLILSDKKTCDLIIKKLNLKETIVEEISAKKIKEEENNTINYNSTNNTERYLNNWDIPLKEPAMYDYVDFQANFVQMIENNNENYSKKLCQKLCNEQIIIINKLDEFKAWQRCLDYDLDPLIVIPEFDWTSYKDWFGYFDESNKFIPSNTLVSDYYKLLKENPDIPLGTIVVKDFNKILPDIYLEYFIEKITEKITPGLYLAHPHINISTNDEIFRYITLPENLKLILVKSNSPKAFDIPESMRKFEVNLIE